MRILVVTVGCVAALTCNLMTLGCPAPSGSSSPSSSKDKNAADKGEPIAKVGGNVITVEQIQKRLDDQSPFVRVRYQDPAKKKEFLDSQIRFEVLAAEAFARGLDKDPEVLEATKKIIVQKLTREEFDSRVKLADVTDDELKKYFDAHQADYQKPEMARASDIAIAFGSDAASKAAAKKKAEEAQKKANDKAKIEDRNWFKDLVTRYSTDEATKRAGGDIRYLTAAEVEEKYGPAVKTWLFSSEMTNEVSPVIEGKDAWHVLKRTGSRKPIVRTFEQVKNQIKNVVFREKRTDAFNQYVEGLKKKHGVVVYEDKLDKVKVNAMMPPGVDENGNPRDPHAALMPNGFPPPPPTEEQAERQAEKQTEKQNEANDTGGEGKP